MNIRRPILVAVTLAALSACSEPFAPESIAGIYEVRGFDKVDVQVERHWLHGSSATLVLGVDGYGMRIIQVVQTDVETGEVRLVVHEEPLTYVIDGMRLVTSSTHDCPGGCSSVPDPIDYRILPGGQALKEIGISEPMTFVRR